MKRALLIAILLVATSLFGALFATDYNVLVYPANEEIELYIDKLFPSKEFSLELYSTKLQRQNTQKLKSLGEGLASAYSSESESSIEKARESYEAALQDQEVQEAPFDVVLVNSSVTYDDQAIVSGDLVYLKYMCESSGADLILLPRVSSLSGFIHLQLFSYEYGASSLDLIYEAVSKDSDRFTVKAALELARLFSGQAPAVLQLQNVVAGTNVTVDGQTVGMVEDYIVTTEGRHIIALSALGHEDRLIATTLEADSVSYIDASLKQVNLTGLRVLSDPQATLRIDGVEVGTTPLEISSYQLPLALRLSSEGYSPRTISLMEEKEEVKVTLQPLWMSESGLLKDAKDEFYSDFARSLIMFGAKVALMSFNDGTNTFLTSVDVVATGALTISLVDLVGSLIDYYRASEYSAN